LASVEAAGRVPAIIDKRGCDFPSSWRIAMIRKAQRDVGVQQAIDLMNACDNEFLDGR
jgi:hypothetical protein